MTINAVHVCREFRQKCFFRQRKISKCKRTNIVLFVLNENLHLFFFFFCTSNSVFHSVSYSVKWHAFISVIILAFHITFMHVSFATGICHTNNKSISKKLSKANTCAQKCFVQTNRKHSVIFAVLFFSTLKNTIDKQTKRVRIQYISVGSKENL